MKKTKTIMTGWEIINELAELEPKNFVDYILRGSAINQFMKKHKMGVFKDYKEKS